MDARTTGWPTIRALRPDEVDAVGSVLGLARLHQGDGAYLVAWDGSRPVGHVHLTAGVPPEVQDLEVLAERRRQGVATALIAHAEALCRNRGDRSLVVTVSQANDAARQLYERLGFHDTGAAPRRVTGTVEIRTGTIEVDDVLLTLAKPL